MRPGRVRGQRWGVGSALVAGALAAACGDDGKTVVDLTVVETLPVDFDQMQGGVAEGADFQLDDLRDEPAYVAAQKAAPLKCVGVDLATSFIDIRALDVAAGATVLSYDVAIAPHGQTNFETLLSFNGSVSADEKIPMTSSKFVIDASGLAALSSIALGGTPHLDVQITGEVPAGVNDLEVELSLAFKFAADANGCATNR